MQKVYHLHIGCQCGRIVFLLRYIIDRSGICHLHCLAFGGSQVSVYIVCAIAVLYEGYCAPIDTAVAHLVVITYLFDI